MMRLQGKKVIYWGHGFYGNESFWKKAWRIAFYKLAHQHFLYGNRAKEIMVSYGFKSKNLHVVYNSLDYDHHCTLRSKCVNKRFYEEAKLFSDNRLPVLLFIGRLTKQKRLSTLIESVKVINQHGNIVNLIIIGDGPEFGNLHEQASELKGNIHFTGALYDEQKIGKYLANAVLCVSPGNVGLTAIHSLSFGTPVCTHNNMALQMPEAEAVIEGRTGALYDLDKMNLREKISAWLQNGKDREEIRKECYGLIDQYFNPYYQLEVFKKVLTNSSN